MRSVRGLRTYGGGLVSDPMTTTETYYAVRLPNRRLWDGKDDTEAYDRRVRDVQFPDGVVRMWFSCTDAENQLRELRGRAERLGTAEAFARAEVVPFRSTVTITEVDRDADTVVTERVVEMRWKNAEDIRHGAWFRVPGSDRDAAVVWQRRGDSAVAVNAVAETWRLATVADYYAANGGYLEVLDSSVPCLDCEGVGTGKLGNCPRCYGNAEVSR